jgi:putative transposase
MCATAATTARTCSPTCSRPTSKAFNKAYGRTGSLFAKPFRRKRVDRHGYCRALVVYIHQNPQRHGLIDDFREWPYRSHATIAGLSRTRVQRNAVISWCDDQTGYLATHQTAIDDLALGPLLLD